MATPLVDGGFLREPWQHRTYKVPPLVQSPFVYRPGKRSMTVDIINRHGVLIRGTVYLGEAERVMARLTEDVAAGLGYAVRMATMKPDCTLCDPPHPVRAGFRCSGPRPTA